MKHTLLIALLSIAAACGGEKEPEPIELAALLDEEAPAAEADALQACPAPVIELRLDDWQAFLDLPLGDERPKDVPSRPTPRRLLHKWAPVSLLEPGPAAARLQVDALTVGVDAAGIPGISALDAVVVLEMPRGTARDALLADLERWIESLRTVVPGPPSVTTEPSAGSVAVRIRFGAPDTGARAGCRPATATKDPASGLRVRVGVQALLAVVERAAGPLLLWSVLPEELGRWRTVDLVVRPGGADSVTLRVDAGDGVMADLVREARYPAQAGWDRFLPPASPVTAGFFLHEAETWTSHLSDLMFEKGFKSKDFDPVEILNESWQSQLCELLSGPAVGFPIVKKYDLKHWDEGWVFYLQPKDVSELQGRLTRVFNLKRYVTRPETFRDRDLTVVRYKKHGKGGVGGVRFAWYCEEAGCWLSRTMGGFDRLFDVEGGASTAQAERVRDLVKGDTLAFAVVNPRTFGERFHLPEKKKKKKRKKGALPLPSLGDREDIARKVVENAVRGALTELPEDLLVTAALRSDGDALELEVTGLFRLLGRVATKFLPLL